MDELSLLTNELLHSNRRKQAGKAELVFLLDGYDEIDYPSRVQLSAILRDLESINKVRFILTCRMFYEVVDLRIQRYFLQPFTVNDSCAFVGSLLSWRGSRVNPEELIETMRGRGFADFISNPLFLALSVLLQRWETPRVPRNAIKLLENVVDYLAFHWDFERGIPRTIGTGPQKCVAGTRPSVLPDLDGRDLLKCLKRIAARFEEPEGSQYVAETEVKQYLELLQNEKINPHDLMMELARWFGLFVPGDSLTWSFVHRSVHEFLAAKHMVDSGSFTPADARKNWRRAHYAACFMNDASPYIVQALDRGKELEMFVECSANDAYFYPVNVIHALMRFYDEPSDSCHFAQNEAEKHISVTLEQDYLDVVKTPFLREWIALASVDRAHTRGAPIGLALALSELHKRGEPISSFDATRYGKHRWTVVRAGLGSETSFQSSDLQRLSSSGASTD